MTAPNEGERETAPAAPQARVGARPAPRFVPPRRRPGAAARLLRGAGAVVLWSILQMLTLIPPTGVGVALGLLVGAGFVWWYVVRRGYPGEMRRRATLRLRLPIPSVVGWLPALAALSCLFTAASAVIVARFIAPPKTNRLIEIVDKRPYGWVALLVLAAILAPMLEEVLFRGWLQRTLERRWPAAQAIAVTALVFATAHGERFGFLSRFVVGLTLGYVAYASRSILPSVLLHASYNATLIVGGLVAKGMTEATLTRLGHTPRALAPAAVLSVLAALGLAWSLRRMGEQAAAARRAGRGAELRLAGR